ncbi:Mediator of RNA polymerase II transcription subunit 13 [Papilio xuthus]|uniref:Mediator of RNA polymerase II transcription subunit 13 n=1 Tax=Papilio xuthus TaxID=66420 RepID=A0A194QHG5_PAPXU|nr:Mediator of RNA polymerase II transcription subunit 13 [Papilio xuthus]
MVLVCFASFGLAESETLRKVRRRRCGALVKTLIKRLIGDQVTSCSYTHDKKGDHGSWESGLSYECRSLLFKALHNLIESIVAMWLWCGGVGAITGASCSAGRWHLTDERNASRSTTPPAAQRVSHTVRAPHATAPRPVGDTHCAPTMPLLRHSASPPTSLCLLSRDFVRLGKWFVQPYDGDEEDVGKSPWHLSFSFAFFLHGESTVCASVDVRQHPPVRTLTAKRLARLARLAVDDAPRDARPDTAHHANVILAPFGLEGRVTGREWSDGDAATARLLDAWRQLYPLEHGCGAVEVECGGVRMRYPLPYALLTEMEAPAPAPPPAAAALAGRTLRALTTPHPHQVPPLTASTQHWGSWKQC